MDFEKYREHLISFWMPEYEALHSTRELMAAGWNMLLDEVLSPIIEKELGMRYLGNRVWADDYSNHRRRVLSLFQQTDLGGSFKWGWNFDFIPKMSGGKAVYVRTDKSIFTHFFENVHLNHNPDEKFCKTSEMFFDRCNIDTLDYENAMKKKVKEHTDAFYKTLPLIKAFYEETKTYEQTVKMIDYLMEHDYYLLIQGHYLQLTKIFLNQYMNPCEENEKNLRELLGNDDTRDSFCKKLAKVPDDYNKSL